MNWGILIRAFIIIVCFAFHGPRKISASRIPTPMEWNPQYGTKLPPNNLSQRRILFFNGNFNNETIIASSLITESESPKDGDVVILENGSFKGHRVFVDFLQHTISVPQEDFFQIQHPAIKHLIGRKGVGETILLGCSNVVNGNGGGSISDLDYINLWSSVDCTNTTSPSTILMTEFSRLDVQINAKGSLYVEIDKDCEKDKDKEQEQQEGYIFLSVPASNVFSSVVRINSLDISEVNSTLLRESYKSLLKSDEMGTEYWSHYFVVGNNDKCKNVQIEVKVPVTLAPSTFTSFNNFQIWIKNNESLQNISPYILLQLNMLGIIATATLHHSVSNNNLNVYKGANGYANYFHISNRGAPVHIIGGNLNDVFVLDTQTNKTIDFAKSLQIDGGKGENTLIIKTIANTQIGSNLLNDKCDDDKSMTMLSWLDTSSGVNNIQNILGECLRLEFHTENNIESIYTANSIIQVHANSKEYKESFISIPTRPLKIHVVGNTPIHFKPLIGAAHPQEQRKIQIFYNPDLINAENVNHQELVAFENARVSTLTSIQINIAGLTHLNVDRKTYGDQRKVKGDVAIVSLKGVNIATNSSFVLNIQFASSDFNNVRLPIITINLEQNFQIAIETNRATQQLVALVLESNKLPRTFSLEGQTMYIKGFMGKHVGRKNNGKEKLATIF